MTEQDWLSAEDARDMLNFLRASELGPAPESRGRKYRLFACACVRRTAERNLSEANLGAVGAAELLADGRLDQLAVAQARTAGATGAARRTLLRSPRMAAHDVCWPHTAQPGLAELLRCIFGNPFRPFHPAHVPPTPTVASLARAAYDERVMPGGQLDPVRLAVLADAFEEAGGGGDLLDHLRGPGLHARGCWAVDVLRVGG